MRTLLPLVLVAGAPARAQDPAPAETIAPAGWKAEWRELRDRILPRAEEERWLDVGWRPAFWDAVVEAQERRKPILLWAMNGHPLGCT